MLAENIKTVEKNIKEACARANRSASDVTLIAVSKTKPVDMMKEIGRWYNIDIEFRNSKIMDLRMHFFANRHQDIYHLIELLNRMERIHAYFEAGKLIIE